ncbi:hypothetical protein [[Flexibacter] sp. ATCC 35208]|uniref:hypothetical protein n=1 Tax=[Flexibacter] sp. ATCC 35208 TaxID=1936242 RepID=UPI0009C6B58C|nr:hypothetical protein [[Flexibacter] sp. ATCC 35208]OMP74892.1 hypothetical protein BW716_32900 [[Flexibacter] sp. ATCC 35208]
MSKVTNLIITFSTLEDEQLVIEQIKLFDQELGFNIVSVNDERLPNVWYGGTRRLECCILIGAYNNLDLEKFILFLATKVEWEAADLVQLLVKEQEDMKFKLIDLSLKY